jgi:hypothetical protein
MPRNQALDFTEYEQWLLERASKFHVDFPAEFPKIKQLVKTHSIEQFRDDDEALEGLIRHRLGRIVYGMTRRYRDPEYEKNISDLKKVTAAAGVNLDKIAEGILRLDEVHTEDFGNTIGGLAEVGLDAFSSESLGHQMTSDVLVALKTMSRKAKLIAAVVKWIAMFEDKPVGRSRPTLPYLRPTLLLMEEWVTLTGTPVVAPKGFVSGEATQPSTEFIRLALKMIDPKVTAANTISSIKRALITNKKVTASASNRSGTAGEIVLQILKELGSPGKSQDPT